MSLSEIFDQIKLIDMYVLWKCLASFRPLSNVVDPRRVSKNFLCELSRPSYQSVMDVVEVEVEVRRVSLRETNPFLSLRSCTETESRVMTRVGSVWFVLCPKAPRSNVRSWCLVRRSG